MIISLLFLCFLFFLLLISKEIFEEFLRNPEEATKQLVRLSLRREKIRVNVLERRNVTPTRREDRMYDIPRKNDRRVTMTACPRVYTPTLLPCGLPSYMDRDCDEINTRSARGGGPEIPSCISLSLCIRIHKLRRLCQRNGERRGDGRDTSPFLRRTRKRQAPLHNTWRERRSAGGALINLVFFLMKRKTRRRRKRSLHEFSISFLAESSTPLHSA